MGRANQPLYPILIINATVNVYFIYRVNTKTLLDFK
jgi:hypothetical protein